MYGFFFLMLLIVVGVLGVLGGFRYLAALERREGIPGDRVGRSDFQRLEDALVALESRLERLEDNQRFLEGLLERRPAPRSLPPPEPTGEPEPEGERGVDSVLFDVEPEEG